jgi:hypothetical protein
MRSSGSGGSYSINKTNIPITQSLLHEWDAMLLRTAVTEKRNYRSRRRAFTEIQRGGTLYERTHMCSFLFSSLSPIFDPVLT